MSANALFSVLPKPLKRKRIRESHRVHCGCGHRHADADTKSRDTWQRRLWWTGIDRKGRDILVGLENTWEDLHGEAGDAFVDVLTDLHFERGYLTGDDIARALETALDSVIDTGADTYLQDTLDLSSRAQEQALEKAGIDPVTAATRRLMAYASTRVAQDDFGDRIRRNYDESMSRIKSLPDSVVEDLRAKLQEALLTGASTREVIRAIIGEQIAEIDELDPKAVRDAIREIWQKTKSDLERVVRTESINNYAKTQLQEWYDQGIRQVTRHSVNDERTCPKCRELSRPGHNVYDIEVLLRLEHPVTEDPDAPGEWLTHPHCRDWFRPVLENVWDEIEDLRADLFADLEGESVVVTDVPLDDQDPVKEMIRDWNVSATDIEAEFGFVEDITKDPDWQRFRLEELQVEDLETAEQRLQEEIDEGAVTEWVHPETEVKYIADEAAEVNYVTLPMARRQGEIRWDDAGDTLRDWWRRRYNAKMAETKMTLEEEGVQIIGGLPFFTQAAGTSARDYFVEAYAHYMVDPVLVHALDRSAYDRLRDHVFGGVEYLERGGIN